MTIYSFFILYSTAPTVNQLTSFDCSIFSPLQLCGYYVIFCVIDILSSTFHRSLTLFVLFKWTDLFQSSCFFKITVFTHPLEILILAPEMT